MKKKKKIKNNDKYLLLIILFLLVFSYFEINSNLRFGGIVRDIIFTPFKKEYKEDLINLIDNELKKENDELKELLEIDYSLTDFEAINGSVIERNLTYFLNELTINKGTKDSVNKSQLVITKDGMIGEIISSSYNTSKVKLITSFSSPISVSINDINKVLFVSDYELFIKGINTTDNIKVGDKVLTSGLSNNYPKGILIGEIDEIKSENNKTGLIAKVKLTADINNIKFVSILKRKDV